MPKSQQPAPFIDIRMGSFSSSQGRFEIGLHFRNIGLGPAILQSLAIADESFPIPKRTVAVGEEMSYSIEVTGKKILQRKLDAPRLVLSYKDMLGHSYEVIATAVQEKRADGNYNIQTIEDVQLREKETENTPSILSGEILVGEDGGQFTVANFIGEGGFGTVYEAKDKENRECAIKIIPIGDDERFRESFAREISLARSVQHPGILTIIDYGQGKFAGRDVLFVVSELCKNGNFRSPLNSYVDAGGNIELSRLTLEFTRILEGLGALHAKIIHRDLKPENILIQGDSFKICDFGLAKLVDQATKTLTFKGSGTPRYMAPEIWREERGTISSDLYAIGVMLFEAVTGRPPFVGSSSNDLRQGHLFTVAPRAKNLNQNTPEFLDGVIKKLLEKDPSYRYQTADALITDLQKVAIRNDGPTVVQPIVVSGLVNRAKQYLDIQEDKRLAQAQGQTEESERKSLVKFKEKEVISLFDDVVKQFNQEMPESRIELWDSPHGRVYSFGDRHLELYFFDDGELYDNPIVPGRMEVLKKHNAIHGGYIELRENGQDREGWNLVLTKAASDRYGKWTLVETRISALVPKRAQYEPFATKAQLLADNLANHWGKVMHSFNLTTKELENKDALKILEQFIPVPA